jgi:L-amino acid N-acyltransferase YncA
MAARGRALVDGRGAARVVAVMRSRQLAIRGAVEADARLLWEWANDPTVRAAAFSLDPIPWTSHQAWLRARLDDPACRIYVAEQDGRPLGQIRFEQVGSAPGRIEVDVSLVVGARGRGWGSALIVAGVERLRQEGFEGTVHALAKMVNLASIAAFDAAGFDRVSEQGDCAGVLHLVARSGQAGRDGS